MQPVIGGQTEADVALSGRCGPGAGPIDESVDLSQDLLLVQMHYEEYLARSALQELFESGQLESLCG